MVVDPVDMKCIVAYMKCKQLSDVISFPPCCNRYLYFSGLSSVG